VEFGRWLVWLSGHVASCPEPCVCLCVCVCVCVGAFGLCVWLCCIVMLRVLIPFFFLME
jgi:hypothetical protein